MSTSPNPVGRYEKDLSLTPSHNNHSGKEKEVNAMRNGGNKLINMLFEAKLTDKQKSVVKPDKNTELDPRSSFIYDKYQHRSWYDAKLASRESTFKSSPENGTRISGVEFDDFFASRTKGAAANDWHDSNDGSNDGSFDPRDEFKLSPRNGKANALSSRSGSSGSLHSLEFVSKSPNRKLERSMNHSLSTESAFQTRDADYCKTPKLASSAKGLSFTRTPKSGLGGRANLMSALKRMDSKREMLQTIRAFDIDQENQLISPRMISQTNRRKKNMAQQAEEISRKQGSVASDTKGRSRHHDSRERRTVGRTGSNSDDSVSKSSRKGSTTGGADSNEDPEKPRSSRRVRRSASDDNGGTKDSKERPRREPRRGVGRTRSMEEDILPSESRPRSRSRSTKRVVRRNASSDDASFQSSQHSIADVEASVASARSVTRRPPRRPRTSDDDKTLHSVRSLNESLSSRRSRDDEPRRSRGRSGGEGENSRTPSPSGGSHAKHRSSSRRRQGSVPRKPETNAISVRRVPTVRDTNERSPLVNKTTLADKSPRTRKRTVDPKFPEAGQLFAAGSQ